MIKIDLDNDKQVDYICDYFKNEALENKIEEKDKEIERLNKKIEQYENPEDMTLMFMWCDEKAKDEIKRLNNIIKDIKGQLNYLETYSSKEDVFENMKRRLDRIESIVNRK